MSTTPHPTDGDLQVPDGTKPAARASTSRRTFLVAAAATGAALALGAEAGARSQAGKSSEKPAGTPVKPPPFLISIEQWSYHKALQAKKLDNLDFPKVAKVDHDIDKVELVNTFFKDKAKDDAYLKELKKRADDLGVRILLIMCDAEGDLGHKEKAQRMQAVENHRKWLDAAKFLGCHCIRVNAYGSGTPEEHQAQAAEGLHALCELGDAIGLDVIVENHGGNTSNGAWMAGLMKRVGHRRIGTLPDFGNFNIDKDTHYDRYLGVKEIVPFAKAVSAKCYDFDDKGEETTIDFHRMVKIVMDSGYHSTLGIEYEGERMSEPDGVNAMKKLLLKIRTEIG